MNINVQQQNFENQELLELKKNMEDVKEKAGSIKPGSEEAKILKKEVEDRIKSM